MVMGRAGVLCVAACGRIEGQRGGSCCGVHDSREESGIDYKKKAGLMQCRILQSYCGTAR